MTTKETKTFEIHVTSPARLVYLMTHYRKPMPFSDERLREAKKILNRWVMVAEPTLDGPPIEVLEALMDDINTPLAIAKMHGYRARKEGKKLFASMRFLGLLDNAPHFPDDYRMIPDDHFFEKPQEEPKVNDQN